MISFNTCFPNSLFPQMDLSVFHHRFRNIYPTGLKVEVTKCEQYAAERTISQKSGLSFEETFQQISSKVEPRGFEAHCFLLGWYNEVVDEAFRLHYPPTTPAILFLSTPSMFEKTLIPFLLKQESENFQDPVDKCMVEVFSRLREDFGGVDDVDVIHDFELHPNRRPKLLVQTAAHVSGAAFLYHTKNIPLTDGIPRKKMMGLCLHPKYGGWFAIRGCLVFKNLTCPSLARKSAENVLVDHTDQMSAIELFNYHWKDCRFRDVIVAQEKYSEIQQRYFNTPSGQRGTILKEIIEKYSV